MIIRPIKLEDTAKLSVFHRESLPDTISSKMGKNYLEAIYRSIVKNRGNNLAYLMEEKGQITGAICSTYDLGLFQTQVIKELKFTDYIQILVAIASFKATLINILKRMFFEKTLIKSYKKNYVSILILFTTEKFRRRGIGSRLIKRVLKQTNKKVKYFYVDTLSTNKTALNLYKTLGFKIKKRIADSILLVYENKQRQKR